MLGGRLLRFGVAYGFAKGSTRVWRSLDLDKKHVDLEHTVLEGEYIYLDEDRNLEGYLVLGEQHI